MAGGDGVENGSEQMGTKEMRRVAGKPSGVHLDGIGPQDRRVGVNPLAHVFPSEGGKTGFVVFKDERTEITLRRVSWGFDTTKCPEEGEATREVRSDLHRSDAVTPRGGVSSAEERGDVAAGGVAERLSEAPDLGRKAALVPGQQSPFQHPAAQDGLHLATQWWWHQKESLDEGQHRGQEGVGDNNALLQFV